jgi:SAM-dependent methyltransferase
MTTFAETLNRTYFDGRLAPAVLGHLTASGEQRDEVRSFIERMFRNFHAARIPAQDVSVFVARLCEQVLPGLLPGAWDGIVPPITVRGRHRLIDEYVSHNRWLTLPASPAFLDLGCGFPPTTAIETAERFPSWRVTGLDQSFWPYLVMGEDGDYACFDYDLTLRYFQPGNVGPQAWNDTFRDRNATRTKYGDLLRALLDGHSAVDNGQYAEIRRHSFTLQINPIGRFERANLTFLSGDARHADVRDIDVARCFNVLIYFDAAFRAELLQVLGRILKPGGLFVCGYDWVQTRMARYMVYQNDSGVLRPREFAFSIDNVFPLGLSWYALHDDDEDMRRLVELVGVLRSDSEFMSAFGPGYGALLSEAGLCPRGADGYFEDIEPGIAQWEADRRFGELLRRCDEREYPQLAVAALRRGGLNAWKNDVGHIAVEG